MLRMHNRFSMMLLACSTGLLICSSSAFAFDPNIQLSPLYSNEIKQTNDPSMATPNPTPTLSQPTQNSVLSLQPIDPLATTSNNSSTHNASVPTPNPAIATPTTPAGSAQTPKMTNIDNMFNNDSSLPTPNPVLAPPPQQDHLPGVQPLTPNVSNSHFGLPSSTPQLSVGYNDASKPSPNTKVYPPPPAPPYYARTILPSQESGSNEETNNTATTSGSGNNSSNSNTSGNNSGTNNSSGNSSSPNGGSGGSGGSGSNNNSKTTAPGATPSAGLPSAEPVGSNTNNSTSSNAAPNGNTPATPNKNASQNSATNYAQALRSCTPGSYTGPSQTTAVVSGNIGMSKAATPTVTYQINGIVNGQCQVTMIQQAVTPASIGANGAVNTSISPGATMSKCNFNPNNLNTLASQIQQSANGYASATTSANTQSIMSSSCSSYLMAGNAAVPFQSSGNSSNNTVGNLIGKQ